LVPGIFFGSGPGYRAHRVLAKAAQLTSQVRLQHVASSAQTTAQQLEDSQPALVPLTKQFPAPGPQMDVYSIWQTPVVASQVWPLAQSESSAQLVDTCRRQDSVDSSQVSMADVHGGVPG
jgi:hypothetical protein